VSDVDHVARQRRFYNRRKHAHLQVQSGDYYAHNIARQLVAFVEIGPEHRVLEVGAGFGRFTFPLLEFCHSVVALDLSERVLDSLIRTRDERGISEERCSVRCGDINNLSGELLGEAFDFVVGVFILHHLPDFARTIRELVPFVKPGGGMAFVEPNRRNPAFLAQVAISRDMSWGEEKGMFSLTRRGVETAFRRANLRAIQTQSFGFFAPRVLNRFEATRRLERRLAGLRPLRWILPFLLLSARVPQPGGATS
jgi:SAM-dependent methyltransferase